MTKNLKKRLMKITVNGEEKQFDSGFTIADIIAELQLENRRYAVEVNLEIIPKSEHNQHALCDGDRVEIIHAVGGG